MSGGYIMRTRLGSFCTLCQSPLSIEEDDWDECDACGGEGVGNAGPDDDEILGPSGWTCNWTKSEDSR